MKKFSKVGLGTITILSVLPMAAAAISCSSNTITETDVLKAFEELEVSFPKLDSYAYYPFIRMNDAGAYISDDMIAGAVTDVVKGLSLADGEISWSYYRDPRVMNVVFINVSVEKQGNTQTKTYKLKLI